MAIITVKTRIELGRNCVLAPERYDPRREGLGPDSLSEQTVPLGTIARSVRQIIQPGAGVSGHPDFMVFDTSDVREGIVIGRKHPVELADLGSSKKLFQRNDVLISRLRPYLRQVAFVDSEVSARLDVQLACSTEFFVLRSLTDEPIGFLVPYLLAPPVQRVLAASQEGGHHPRFDENALMALPVPESLLAKRAEASALVVESAGLYRQSEQITLDLISQTEAAMTKMVSRRQKRIPSKGAGTPKGLAVV